MRARFHFVAVGLGLAAMCAAEACVEGPTTVVDTPAPGAPAYWESALPRAPRPSVDAGTAPSARDDDTDAGRGKSDHFLWERADDAGAAPHAPNAQAPLGAIPAETPPPPPARVDAFGDAGSLTTDAAALPPLPSGPDR